MKASFITKFISLVTLVTRARMLGRVAELCRMALERLTCSCSHVRRGWSLMDRSITSWSIVYVILYHRICLYLFFHFNIYRFFCLLAAYLLVGFIYNMCAGATGRELIPNYEMWQRLPNDILVRNISLVSE